MSDIQKIRTLTERFFDGATTLREEQELYDFYRQSGPLPPDLAPFRELFLAFGTLPVDSAESLLRQGERQDEPQPARKAARRPLVRVAAAAAVVLLLAGTALLGHRLWLSDEECVAYIYGQRTTDRDVVLDEMHKTMNTLTADGSDVVEEQLKAMFSNE